MREISAIDFAYPKLEPSRAHGKPPDLAWLPLAALRVDESYQRDVLRDGQASVRRIVENFRWSRFAPLVVSRRADGLFAIVDGQHRAIAARTLGLERVPCQIIECSVDEEADAFAAINGNITKPNVLQIFHAKLAAKDPAAVALRAVYLAAGVRVPRNVIAVSKPGETLAIGTLQAYLKRSGAPVLELALRCITETAPDGNVGLVRAPIIAGLCDFLGSARLKPEDVLAAIRTVTVKKCYEAAVRINAVDGGGVRALFELQLQKHVQPLLKHVQPLLKKKAA